MPLEDQVRSLWTARRSLRELRYSIPLCPFAGPGLTRFRLRLRHSTQPRRRRMRTDWHQIAALYGALLRHTPTPVVELNAAVALAMAAGVKEGLDWIGSLEERGELDRRPSAGSKGRS